MIVVFTRKAEADLASIGDYIAKDNRQRARTLVDQLLTKCEELADMPLSFPLYAPERNTQIRRRVHGSYQIIYTIYNGQVVILHVLYSSRNVDRVIFGDD